MKCTMCDTRLRPANMSRLWFDLCRPCAEALRQPPDPDTDTPDTTPHAAPVTKGDPQ